MSAANQMSLKILWMSSETENKSKGTFQTTGNLKSDKVTVIAQPLQLYYVQMV